MESSEYIAWISGILLFESEKIELEQFVQHFLLNECDFNEIFGWYKCAIYDKAHSIWYFWGDNSNSQHFFFDRSTGYFSDSFLNLKSIISRKLHPNYCAIAQILGQGYSIGEDTLINEISRTDKDYYYAYDGHSIIRKSKLLKSFREINNDRNLLTVLNPVCSQISNYRTAVVCTGGTDSRVVLAGLKHIGIKISPVITGHYNNPDLKVAAMVCEQIGEKLTVINPDIKNENWIKDGFVFMDGEYDPVLGYRHYLKGQWEKENNIAYEFGGVAGEIYKNNFCSPFRWLGKVKDANFYYENFLKTNLTEQRWVGTRVIEGEKINSDRLKYISNSVEKENTLLEKGNRIGFDVLAWKAGAITNGYTSVATKIDPLMDRKLCAVSSHSTWLSHVMHLWQRKQIHKYCYELEAVPTDQGYCCSINPVLLGRDIIKKELFYLERVINRLRHILGMEYKSATQHFWDIDYKEARESEIWNQSLKYCQRMDIINPKTDEKEIPLDQTGWIILIGMLFI